MKPPIGASMEPTLKSFIVTFLQSLIILTPIVIFGYLLNLSLVPTGVFTTERAINERSPYLDRLLPDARVETPYKESDGDWVQKIIGDPVFFFVHPPRSFPSVETEIRFKNTGVPIVEFGVLADETTGAYSLKPLQNLIIDNSAWSKTENNGAILLQRNKNFDSITDFLAGLPDRSEIAVYHYDLVEPYRLADYTPSSEVKTVVFFLRGSHEFYTYLKDEDLNFRFGFMDENRRAGADEVDIVVINENNEPVAEKLMISDDNVSDDGSSSWPLTLEIAAVGLPEGVYKIQMKASEDIIFRSVLTTQQKMTFLNRLWLTDGGDYPTDSIPANLVSGGKKFGFATHYASSAQTVLFDQKPLDIDEPYLEYASESFSSGLTKISVSENKDLLVRADGYFAFSPEQYFNPDPIRLTAETDLDRAGVNYIIADYSPPRQDGEWTVATAVLDTSNVFFDEETWKFVISTPTAGSDDRALFVNSIKMTFRGPPLTFGKIWDKLSLYVWGEEQPD